MSTDTGDNIFNTARNNAESQSSAREQLWKKFVKLNPPHAVLFKEGGEEGKSNSQIEISN